MSQSLSLIRDKIYPHPSHLGSFLAPRRHSDCDVLSRPSRSRSLAPQVLGRRGSERQNEGSPLSLVCKSDGHVLAEAFRKEEDVSRLFRTFINLLTFAFVIIIAAAFSVIWGYLCRLKSSTLSRALYWEWGRDLSLFSSFSG